MLNCIIIISIIALFICYDILLSLSRFLAPSRAFETTERYAKRSVKHIFNLMRTYARVCLEYENFSGEELPERFSS